MYKEKLNCLHKKFSVQKNITHSSTIPDRITDAVKNNTKFHNTRARSTRRKIEYKIPQYQSAFHTQKNISQNYTIPERILPAEKYNTKFHNTRARSTRRKYITLNSTIPERVPHAKKYNTTPGAIQQSDHFKNHQQHPQIFLPSNMSLLKISYCAIHPFSSNTITTPTQTVRGKTGSHRP